MSAAAPDRFSGEAKSAGIRAANKLRDDWKGVLARGQAPFSTVVEMSRSGEYRALAKLRLVKVLESKTGWSRTTAESALRHNDIDVGATVESIRRSSGKCEAFEHLLASSSTSWRTRPEMPDGWPWRGKLALLVKQSGALVPDELAADAEPDSEAALRSLMGLEP